MSDLIERAAAIQVARDTDYIGLYVGDVKKVTDEVIKGIKAIPIAEPKVGEWIPCEERLPNETKARYLICTDDGYMCMCRWTNVNIFWTNIPTDWHWNLYDVPQYSKVVAWMPIKPYKMKRNE